ncbi:Glucomannan 4-beta-mannosyltransferase 7 [Geodia barretti]|uniref:Glucomannan 4-beta-mannosyltransferase 7 n=1 Tax=Geodia barretti TaxID=519541 RepID=A0AA35QYG3_GEOBA|nr:Glucomannan 4-beta-mannosyltransferase 7 [Geodia barretti]
MRAGSASRGLSAVASGTLLLLLPFALREIGPGRGSLAMPGVTSGREREDWEGSLPRVTVHSSHGRQRARAWRRRLIDAAARLRYPSDRLEIQLLDDSTDGTSERAALCVDRWRRQGVDIRHLKRDGRAGFKAGALAGGLEQARGDFLLILDADFVARPDLIHRLLGPFLDPKVGMVQARWDHLNEGESQLTRCQAQLLDAHFFFEQGGRWAAGRFLNFNGTAGMWRREALEEAGGWSADTLTEDLDASYRAQMAGWRFVFRPLVGVPAELPGTVRDLELQQKRWAQGGIQTARKVLPKLLGGPWPLGIKWEAAVHLLGHLAHPLTLVLAVLIVPSALARKSLGLDGWLVVDVLVFLGATASFLVFFAAAARRRGRAWRHLIPTAALTLALGIGLGATVSRAVVRGAVGRAHDPFQRTPETRGGRAPVREPSRTDGRADQGGTPRLDARQRVDRDTAGALAKSPLRRALRFGIRLAGSRGPVACEEVGLPLRGRTS